MAHLQNLRSSNLLGMRTAIILYFSMKCSAISPKEEPAATTCTNADVMIPFGFGRMAVQKCSAAFW